MIKFQPTLVNHSVLRAYGIEHPIGDPFSGAAYGDKHKGGSVLGGLGGVGAIIGGIAVIASGGTLAPLIGGLMIAGGAMSTIGAISGNAELMKIGGYTAAVGGIAGLGVAAYSGISSALAESSLAETAGTAVGDSVGAASSSTGGAAAASGDTLVDIPGVGWNTGMAEGASTSAQMSTAATPASFDASAVSGAYGGGGYVDQMTNAIGSQINETAPLVSDSLASNMNSSNMLASTQGMTDAGGVSLNSIGSSANAGQAGSITDLPGTSWNFGAAQGSTVPTTLEQSLPGATVYGSADGAAGAVGSAAGTGSTQEPGILASVGKFIEKNPMASMIGMQAVSGLAQGASPKSQAEGDYLDAMTQLKQAETSYLEAVQNAKVSETQANADYLQAKAAEFDKTKAYAEEKRKAYNDSIKNLTMPTNMVDYNTSLFNPTTSTNQAGIINAARA